MDQAAWWKVTDTSLPNRISLAVEINLLENMAKLISQITPGQWATFSIMERTQCVLLAYFAVDQMTNHEFRKPAQWSTKTKKTLGDLQRLVEGE